MWIDEFIGHPEAIFAARVDPQKDQANEAGQPAAAPGIAMLGVAFDSVTLEETVRRIEQMVASRQPHYLVTANADFLVQAQHDVELHRVLLEAHSVLCDGTPLVWASRWLGNGLPERVAGSDLVPRLIQVAAAQHYRIFFLGGKPDVTEQAVARLKAQYPALTIAGHCSPPFKPLLEWNHAEINRQIREAKPDLLFVAFGAPKAEKWMAMNYRSLGVPVMIGIGGTIDFLAGRLRRAPAWMQRTGTEWLFRWLQEPRRLFRRYVMDLWEFPRAMAAQWWTMQWRWRRPAAPLRASLRLVEPTWQRIQVPEHFDADSIRRDARLWDRVAAGRRHCLLELAHVHFIDSTAVALLIHLKRRLRKLGHELVLLEPSAPLRRTLALLRLEDFFAVAPDAVEARQIIEARSEERAPVVVNGASRPVAWQGEITEANTGKVWKVMREQIKTLGSQPKRLPVDLSDVRFIDSAGIRLMARLKKYARRQGIQLQFVEAQSVVRTALRSSDLKTPLLGK